MGIQAASGQLSADFDETRATCVLTTFHTEVSIEAVRSQTRSADKAIREWKAKPTANSQATRTIRGPRHKPISCSEHAKEIAGGIQRLLSRPPFTTSTHVS